MRRIGCKLLMDGHAFDLSTVHVFQGRLTDESLTVDVEYCVHQAAQFQSGHDDVKHIKYLILFSTFAKSLLTLQARYAPSLILDALPDLDEIFRDDHHGGVLVDAVHDKVDGFESGKVGKHRIQRRLDTEEEDRLQRPVVRILRKEATLF